MTLPVLALVVIVVLSLGYRYYGRFIARQYAIDPDATTPAVAHQDGVDFVPTKPFYLLGQHFSAIAAAGPIAGPILACQQFGWLPSILWIALGVVFIGAVHDFSTLLASVRHDARSIAEVVRVHLGRRAWLAMMTFIWVALIYVIVAFTDITASTFVSGDAELAGLKTRFNQGGAVAMASTLYLGLAVVMGIVDRLLRPPLWLQTLIFVPATFVAVWAGTQLSTVLILDARTWAVIILAYCFVASLTPVWALLQPRGYLGGFVLYTALAVGVVGIFFGGFEVKQPAFTTFNAGGPTGLLFPFLFVTIACGACSGFHGLVCSGTTSKQLAKETHAHPVGYGAMLLEAFVALIALGTIMIAGSGKAPGLVYGEGLGRFLTVIIGTRHLAFAITFGAMAFSTFIFDTLDVSTRLGRYILQELFGLKSRAAATAATAITCATPLAALLAAGAGSYKNFWTLFGTSNQLLAGLSLLGIAVWLKRSGRRVWFALAPMAFVMAVTVVSLLLQIKAALVRPEFAFDIVFANGMVSLVLLALAGLLGVEAARAWTLPRRLEVG
jgi:carbon starvation protein